MAAEHEARPEGSDPRHDAMSVAERQTWLALLAVTQGLVPRLDEHHKRAFGISHLEYSTLIMLAESEDGESDLSSLARRVNSSLSRMSHAIRRLQGDGLVSLARSVKDRRATVASLTEAGARLLEAATPVNMTEVRRLVFEPLSDEQREQLRDISLTLLASWRPDDPHPWVP